MFYRHIPPTVHSPGVLIYSLDSSTAHAQKLAVLEGISLAHYVKEFPVKGMYREHSHLFIGKRIYTAHTSRGMPCYKLIFPKYF